MRNPTKLALASVTFFINKTTSVFFGNTDFCIVVGDYKSVDLLDKRSENNLYVPDRLNTELGYVFD